MIWNLPNSCALIPQSLYLQTICLTKGEKQDKSTPLEAAGNKIIVRTMQDQPEEKSKK